MIARSAAHQIKYYVLTVSEWVFTRAGSVTETEPTKYWFSTLPEETPFDPLVDMTKLRWRIERDYQELKQELCLGDYEGRGWRGFDVGL
jgi:SRSO17 transposase